MKFGLHSVNLHTCGYPDAAARIGRAAGVDRLIVRPRPEMDAAALERFAAEAGRALGLRAV
jgi:hypothetical protein